MKKGSKKSHEVGLQSSMMTDLVFTLFIFFILVSTLKKDSVEIKAAKASKTSASSAKKTEQHTISMDSKNQIYVDGKLVKTTELRTVLQEIKNKLPQDAKPAILLRPDANSQSAQLIEILGALNETGLNEAVECEVEKQ